MSEEPKDKSLERPHTVDGIKEMDNPLPRWWLGLFIGTIAYAFIYFIWIHFAGGPQLANELQEDLAAEQVALEQARSEAAATSTASSGGADATQGLASQITNSANIKEGEAHFVSYCSPCHRVDLGGQIGPNLTDNHWIHGCKPEEVIKTITDGVPAKGMAAWGPILGEKKIVEVSAYIFSKIGSAPQNPKAAEGEPCEWKPSP